MAFVIVSLWVLSAGMCAKLDAVLVGEKTTGWDILMAIFIWPIIAICLITTKHHITNGGQDDWDY